MGCKSPKGIEERPAVPGRLSGCGDSLREGSSVEAEAFAMSFQDELDVDQWRKVAKGMNSMKVRMQRTN